VADDDPNDRRIALAVSCRDADVIPKVPDAGLVRDGVQIMHNGVLVEADGYQGPWMTEIIRRLRGHHEPQEELAFHVVAERLAATATAPVVLELGSWWAYYSLWALHRLPGARSFCVEPDPAYLEQGRRNFALNRREATFHQAAVGQLALPPQPFLCESDGLEHDVPVEGLGSLLDRFGLERADLVLVDVQGAETPLLDGGRELLRGGRVRFMVISTHHHRISGDPLTHDRCLMLLRELGAHVVTEHTVAESFTGDGLIVASFDERDRDLHVVTSRCRVGDSLFGDPLWDLDAARNELSELRSKVDALEGELRDLRARVHGVEAPRRWKLRTRLNRSLSR
jgi:FkbM family methyltransferase